MQSFMRPRRTVRLRGPRPAGAEQRETCHWAAGVGRPVDRAAGASSSAWSRERLRIVLLHEMAHIRRRDSLTQALAELAFCLYWFHPLVWLALRRLRAERERACDDLVLRAGTGASDYAAHLLAVARSFQSSEFSPAAVSMAAPGLEIADARDLESEGEPAGSVLRRAGWRCRWLLVWCCRWLPCVLRLIDPRNGYWHGL